MVDETTSECVADQTEWIDTAGARTQNLFQMSA